MGSRSHLTSNGQENQQDDRLQHGSIKEVDAEDASPMKYLTTDALEPWVMRKVDLGACVNLWNLDYLESRIGHDTSVPVHHGNCRDLQFFPTKNFVYKNIPFKELKSEVESGSHVYLRSLASTSPFQKPANLNHDFPTIAPDFQIPAFLGSHFHLSNRIHSSVLRLSGNVAVWLHYDVMSNFLFQIHGSKTVILFPPTSAVDLKFGPGSTTSPVPIADIEASVLRDEDKLSPGIGGRAVVLNPGDVLFIPRFWPHATIPVDQGHPVAVAVNVFWRDLECKSYAAGRDVYGSRDLGIYENGRLTIKRVAERLLGDMTGAEQKYQHVESLAQYLSAGQATEKLDLKRKSDRDAEKLRRKMLELPKDVGGFYLPRLANELLVLSRPIRKEKT